METETEQVLPHVGVRVDADNVRIGWVSALVHSVGPSPDELVDAVREAAARASSSMEDPAVDARKGAVRRMLRFGGYKPSGRAKPASEYLLNAALKDAFPLINNLVDINNLVSLEFMLPMSLIDLDLAGTSSFVVRKGREDEAYVFNPSGQILALADLLLTASLPGDSPCASPVKDSQATKVHAGSRRLAGIVYAPAELADEAAAAAGRMADLLSRFGAVQTAHGVR